MIHSIVNTSLYQRDDENFRTKQQTDLPLQQNGVGLSIAQIFRRYHGICRLYVLVIEYAIGSFKT